MKNDLVSVMLVLTSVFVFALLGFSKGALGGGPFSPVQSTTGPVPPPNVKEAPRVTTKISATALNVPAYIWRHGCGPTAVGMVVGYWDSYGYPDLIPGDASTQTTPVNQALASGGNSASPNPPGAEAHYEDYSRPEDTYPTMLTDDCIDQNRSPHTDNCIADFMSTSKSTRSNYYGWSWSSDIILAFENYVSYVQPNYTGSSEMYFWSSLTWDILKNEIDNNRPMVFLVDSNGDGTTDHFVTIIAYRDDNGYQEYGCRDTWYSTMRWCRFREVSASYPWGVFAGWSFSIESSADIPTLNEWGMVMLFILLLGSALWVIRRRKRQESI